eukprot:CAMPEP_0201686376 /NCGR_PEP_ID=MMETSP0578-20130828/843_1 /ASSEMBLY_ACC=CAM_ASM_000663 /TAXON_ID=267565 /ORGANISM="Skeletonema grethea, Strain CCMP 1804" /LENGTH=221 /DNA_ID=CAMNT_0048170425 /DNA_START=101 /DNA_END=766 /DNA_ORIENTATION=+
MKTSTIVVTTTAALVSFGSSSLAFQATTPRSIAHRQRSSSSSTTLYEYIPSGFTKQSWAAFKAKEEQAKKAKNLGRMGPKGFKSRSMQSFQEALERGEAEHLLPVFNAKQKVARGELKEEDIPYMQRGGAWDNSDVKGAKKKRWLSSDKDYADGGYRKAQSVSILGEGQGLDWTGKRNKTGPGMSTVKPGKFTKNYQAPNVNAIKGGGAVEKPKKKMFGFF